LPLASAIDPNRGYKATLLRSPDRVIGLADATRQSSRTRTFGLSAFAYVKDSRFVLIFIGEERYLGRSLIVV
jgi:hypothetical protein